MNTSKKINILMIAVFLIVAFLIHTIYNERKEEAKAISSFVKNKLVNENITPDPTPANEESGVIIEK